MLFPLKFTPIISFLPCKVSLSFLSTSERWLTSGVQHSSGRSHFRLETRCKIPFDFSRFGSSTVIRKRSLRRLWKDSEPSASILGSKSFHKFGFRFSRIEYR